MDIKKIGNYLVDGFHYIALFVIGGTIIWSAVYEYIAIMQQDYAKLKDILLLFIYLELGAMIGIYFKTKKLPIYFLIFIAITALARHLVIDVQSLKTNFDLYLILTIVIAILILSVSVFLMGKNNIEQ
jgi:phosphate starvation-inducible membrane PsiE